MRLFRFVVAVLCLPTVAAAVPPSGVPPQAAQAAQAALAHLNGRGAALGLTARDVLHVRSSRPDGVGRTHVRVDQVYAGLPVFEGEAIVHLDRTNRVLGVTNALRKRIAVDVTPAIGSEQAVAEALATLGAANDTYYVDFATLKVLPKGERSEVDRLVWHVRVRTETEESGPADWEYFVDAHDGLVAFAYDALETSAATGTGNTMYSGQQPVATDFATDSYSLRDLTRGGGNYACDAGNKVDTATAKAACTTVTRTVNIFGNGVKGVSDRATAAADAHFGMQATWDFFKTTFGRNGIDGTGRKTYSRVHYGTGYESAFWRASCFCMTYGDGASYWYPVVALDVAAHEMSHGVMSSEARLTYAGESGGLNESSSDIFAALVEFWANNASDVGDWWIGERLWKSSYSTGTYVQSRALRYMDNPGKDGRSPACWTSTIGSLNVHYSSGPNNHMFYLLANGGTSKCNGTVVTGIGRDTAGRIWYDAIANRMTSSTNYKGARTACLGSAAALYGSGSPEYNAVAAAYSAIGVN